MLDKRRWSISVNKYKYRNDHFGWIYCLIQTVNSWDLEYCTICSTQGEKSPSCDFCLFLFFHPENNILLGSLVYSPRYASFFFFFLTKMTGLQLEIYISWHSPFSFYCWSQKCSAVLKYETLLLYFGATSAPKNVNGWKCCSLLWKQKHLHICFTNFSY